MYAPNCTEEVVVIKKVINRIPWTYGIEDLNGEEFFGMYCEEELQKTNQSLKLKN